jgi:hypothetical protein
MRAAHARLTRMKSHAAASPPFRDRRVLDRPRTNHIWVVSVMPFKNGTIHASGSTFGWRDALKAVRSARARNAESISLWDARFLRG